MIEARVIPPVPGKKKKKKEKELIEGHYLCMPCDIFSRCYRSHHNVVKDMLPINIAGIH
jgi:hypothetical protein